MTNNAGASITGGGGGYGIVANTGFANVINSGSITGGDGIVANTAANVTNSGSITGTANYGIYAGTNATVTNNAGASIAGGQFGIIASTAGSSSVFNAGAISGGTAAIQFAGIGNTLTLAQGTVISGDVLGTGSDTFQLGGTRAATFDVSQLGPAAQYRGFGTFNKIDSSIWTLTGTSTYAGPVNVNGGTLAVNGDITSMLATVNAGGTLGGNGIVGNTTINAGGMLAPGNSIGLLTVQGNLVFTAASSYMVRGLARQRRPYQCDGTATLGGATVNASFAAGTYVAKQYTILNAAGGLGGSLPARRQHQSASGFTAAPELRRQQRLSQSLSFVLPQCRGLNGNQQNVANALINFFNTTGGIPLVFGASDAGRADAGLRRNRYRLAANHLQCDEAVHGRDDRSVHRGSGRSGSGARRAAFAEEDGRCAYAAKAQRSRSERDA